jgi:hypothetical protein
MSLGLGLGSKLWQGYSPVLSVGGGGGGGATFDIANSVDLSDIAFTNGNLTAERTGFNSFHSHVYGTTSKTSGSFQVTVNVLAGGNFGVGFGDRSETTVAAGSTDKGVFYYSTGAIWYSGFTGTVGPTFTASDVIVPEISGGHVKWKKNGSYIQSGGVDIDINVSSTLSGAVYPDMWWSALASVGNKGTASFASW